MDVLMIAIIAAMMGLSIAFISLYDKVYEYVTMPVICWIGGIITAVIMPLCHSRECGDPSWFHHFLDKKGIAYLSVARMLEKFITTLDPRLLTLDYFYPTENPLQEQDRRCTIYIDGLLEDKIE